MAEHPPSHRPYHGAVSFLLRTSIAVGVVIAGAWFAACSDSPSEQCSNDCPVLGGLIVSNPLSALNVASPTAPRSIRTSSANDGVVYVSLPEAQRVAARDQATAHPFFWAGFNLAGGR